MEIKNIADVSAFSHDKMQKVNLFETKNFFCDVYCLEPGQAQKIHAHAEEDKLYYVLSGQGTFTVDGDSQVLDEQQIVFAPAGSNHGVENTSGERLKLLVFMTPNPNFK